MKDGKRPGTDWMGRMDAAEVNHAVDVLAKIVEEQPASPQGAGGAPVHPQHADQRLSDPAGPRVQVVSIWMATARPAARWGLTGWFVVRHPVQYTGFKLFFKNDKPMMKPEEVLELYPKPMYIQYQ